MSAQVLLADDHVLVRQALKSLLEHAGFKIVGEASDGQEAVHLAQQLQPQIVVMDISMPGFNGIEASRELQRCAPKTKTILLTQHDEPQYIEEALEAGIKGYVLKRQAGSDLIEAIGHVLKGGVYMSPGITGALMVAYGAKSGRTSEQLTARERQVLQLVAEGKTTKDIASLLGIAIKTAESHRTRLMRKLDIHETASLVRYAIRRGLVQP